MKRVRRRSAQATVEFALAVPVFLLLVLALVDFGRMLFTHISLSNSAREMARVLAVPTTSNATAIAAFDNFAEVLGGTNPSTDSVTIRVYDASGSLLASQTGACSLPLASSNCSVPPRSTASEGGWIDVTVSYTFSFVPVFKAPFGLSVLNPSTVLSSTARAFIE